MCKMRELKVILRRFSVVSDAITFYQTLEKEH
jgi:hypothetical protein